MRKTIVALCAGLLGFSVSVGAAGAQQLPMPGSSVPDARQIQQDLASQILPGGIPGWATQGSAQLPLPFPQAPAPAPVPPAAAPVPVLKNCSFGKVEVRPAYILLYCGDAHSALHDISWHSWSVDGAAGRGLLKELTCVPDCATGGYTARWVNFTLGGLVWRDGEPQFTRAYVDGREYRID